MAKLKTYSLDYVKDKYIGKRGSLLRDRYEHKLSMEVIGRLIRKARKEKSLTQEQLGELIGVQKAQISKLESGANSATIDTVLKVFGVLGADVRFDVFQGGKPLDLD